MKKMIFPKAKYLWTMLFCLLTLGANAQTWEQVPIEELTATDVFVIVDITSGRAMSNDGGTSSAPRAVSISLSADNMQLLGDIADNLKWNITGNGNAGYTFHPNGATTWLYSTSSNNGLRVGSGDNSIFTFTSGFLYIPTLSRYVGMYNDSDWRSYTSIHNNIINTQTRFFKFVEVEAAVATPTFSVASGTYYYPQQVFISCADENAVIYYTTDGTRPDGNVNVYNAPITVSESTTVKAIAVVGTDTSNVGTASYTLPINLEDIAALRAATADNTTLYRLNSSAVVTYAGASRNQKFIQDATAGILIDDAAGTITSSYVQGDIMNGLIGRLTTYSQMLEFVPAVDPGLPIAQDSVVAPTIVSIEDINADYEAQLVQVRNVTFATTGEFAASTDYALNESERVNVRLRYAESELVGTPIPSTAQDITAVVYRFNNTFNLVPRNVNDLAEASEALECTEAPTMNACTTELNAVHNTVITSSVASVGNEGCTIRHYGFIAGAGPDILLNNDSESIEIGTSIDAGEDFSFEIDYRGSETIYVRSYAINDIDTAYSDVTTFRPAEPAIYTVTFNIGGNEEEIEPIIFNEGDRPIELPYGYDCKDIQFVGWALDSITGTTTNKPTLYQEFTPTSDTTFYAIFCNSRSQSHHFDYFNITRSSFEETVTAYGTDDAWTAITGNWNDTIHGYCDLFNASGDFMQMNASRGGVRNTTPLPGGISYIYIEANEQMNPRNFTPYFSDVPLTRDNYLTDGIPGETYTIAPDSYDSWYWSTTEGHPYFYLAFTGGAAYINFIGIGYHADLLEYRSNTTDTVVLYEKFCSDNGFEAYSDYCFYIENPTSDTYYCTLEEGICKTVFELHLAVEGMDTTHQYFTSCQPLTLDIPGLDETHTFYESEDYTFIDYSEHEGSYACENWVTYHVTISNETHNEEINICRSNLPFPYNGTVFEIGSESGEYTFTYPTDLGCENTVILTLNIHDGYNTVDEVTICGEEYLWEGFGDMQTLTASGTYYDYRENEWGCTDTMTLVLTLNHEDIDTINAQICEGGVYNLNGFFETEPGEYLNLNTNAGGCDSIVVLLLTQGESFINELDAEICSNGRYVENGFEISGLEPGEYEFSDTIVREGTCDSIVSLHLTVRDIAETPDEVTVCVNILDTFTWNGYTYEELTAMTAPVVVLSAQNGCDSIVTLNLTILESASSDLTEEACGSYVWNSVEYTASGEYQQVFPAANGCDSIVTLYLTLFQPDTVEFEITAQDQYVWNNETYTESGDYTVTFTNMHNCDSVVTLHLTIAHEYTVTFDVNGDQTFVPAQTFSTENDFMQLPQLGDCGNFQFLGWSASPLSTTLLFRFAPQSDTTLYAVFSRISTFDTLTIDRNSFSELTPYGTVDAWSATSVHGFTINGNADLFNAAGNFMQMRSNTPPHPYNIDALPGDITEIHIVGAGTGSPRRWTPYVSDTPMTEENYATVGTPLETLMAPTNSDEIMWSVAFPGKYFYLSLEGGATYIDRISIYFNENENLLGTQATDTVVINETICSGSRYTDNIFNESEAGTYSTTISPEGSYCSTVYILNLAVNEPITEVINETACESFTWNNETHTQSGEYTQIFTAENGCDSIVTLHLTILTADYADFAEHACGSYTWNEEVYTESGDYTQIFTAENGCDSVVTLHLTIFTTDYADFAEHACGSYTWNNEVYTESGDYTQTFTTENGCDSVVTLHLTIFTADHADFAEHACGSYTWNEEVYTESGDYTQTFTTENGCDSVVTLHLSINESVETAEDLSICESDLPYVWNDVTFDEAGTQTVTLTASNGCDSIVTMTVSVTEINTAIEIVDLGCPLGLAVYQENAEYQWLDCESNTVIAGVTDSVFMPADEGTYACIITYEGCTDTTDCIHFLGNGISEIQLSNIKVWPNPARTFLNVECGIENAELQLFDATGKLVLEETCQTASQQCSVNVSALAPGIYVLHVVADGKRVGTRKVVIGR